MNEIEVETDDGKLGEIVDEILSKMADGETVDVEQYARQHPDAADVLRHAVPALQAVAQSDSNRNVSDAATLKSGVGNKLGDFGSGRTLGDFKLIRELGRGGMGVVYEAEQISLGRRVALKLLPFAGMVRGNALQRFRNEVRAAATLDHPNIVSIYSVGEERGVHYYAMQLVLGQSLAEVIPSLAALQNDARPLTADSISGILSTGGSHAPTRGAEPSEELRPKTSGRDIQSTRNEQRELAATMKTSGRDRDFYRSIALLAAQAADALDHAHQHGVIHRDVKPGNLMLDAESQLYVTDFGLARIESDAAMTVTGDLIGTLRYMSPEQALANRVMIDHRSDVYSLGMTLYELLTLRPAFATSDRQELLKKIAFDDPKKPRQCNRSIPPELEIIVLKAIEKKPQDRYATAGKLANDLRAYLSDRPIEAKRPTSVQRVMKWSRRHHSIVKTAVATLLISVLIGVAFLWQERSKTFAALHEVTTQKREAQKQSENARLSEATAIRQRNRARWHQYCAEIATGQLDHQQGRISRLNQKLKRHLPMPDVPDHRGWEWHYLYSLCHPEIRTLEGENASNATWSPDGRYVACAGLIYRADTGERVRRLDPIGIMRSQGAWSPDGTMYAWGTVNNDNCVYVWHRDSDALSELRGHEDSVWCVEWSPDGKQLASGGMDGELWIWDLATRVPTQKLVTKAWPTSLSWSPDGKTLAAGTRGSWLWIWQSGTWELLEKKKLWDEPQRVGVAVSWRPRGDRLAVSGRFHWSILRTSDWSVVHEDVREPQHKPTIAWRPDGNQIALVNGRSLSILGIDDDEVAAVSQRPIGDVESVAWSPNGEFLLTLAPDNRISIFSSAEPFQPPAISTAGPVESLSWLPDSETVVTVGEDGSASFWRVTDGERLKRKPSLHPNPMIWSPDRRFAAFVSESSPPKIEVLDGMSGSVHAIWESDDPDDQVRRIAWSNDGTMLAIRMNWTQHTKVDFWRIDDEKSVANWTQNLRGSGNDWLSSQLVWSPDGEFVAVAAVGHAEDNGSHAHDGHLYVIEVSSGTTQMKRNLAGSFPLTSLAWSPDGRLISVGSSAGILAVLSFETGQVQFTNRVSSTPIRGLAFSPDNARVVSASEDGSVQVHGVQRGEDMLQFQLDGPARHVSWNSDGTRLAVATEVGMVHVWDATRGYEFAHERDRKGELAWSYYRLPIRHDAEEEETRMKQVLNLAPDTLGFWTLRGHVNAKLGEFLNASREFSKALAPGIDRSFSTSYNYCYSLLGSSNTTAFRKFSDQWLNVCTKSGRPFNRTIAAWVCTLRDDDHVDSQILVTIGKQDTNENDNGYISVSLLGAAQFRDGQYELAVKTLTGVVDQLEAMGDPTQTHRLLSSLYILAMARGQLGHDHQARRILAKADAILNETRIRMSWQTRVHVNVLQEQATAMLGKETR